MGTFLLLFSLSEILLSSGVRIITDRFHEHRGISVGIECKYGSSIYYPGNKLFLKRGDNYYYLKNADSLPILKKFIHLLSSDSLFFRTENHSRMNLLKLTFNNIHNNNSPVLNITIGITGMVDELYIASLFQKIPDSVITKWVNPINLLPMQGKHVYIRDKNFIANLSPSSYNEDSPLFLVCSQIINNRGFPISFAPETAPSPFIIYPDDYRIDFLFSLPDKEEVDIAKLQILNWIKKELSNRSHLLVLLADMGLPEREFRSWSKRITGSDINKYRETWECYFLSGFVCSATPKFSRYITKCFPEAEIIK